MSEDVDPGVTAVCNLLNAIATTMMTTGQHAQLRTFLSMFERMNDSTIHDPAARAKLQETVNALRAILEELGR